MDHQKNSPDFYPMPFQRIFTMLFYELCNPEAVLESINWHTLMAFSNAYHYLCPMKGTCSHVFNHVTFLNYHFSTWIRILLARTYRIQNFCHENDATQELVTFRWLYLRYSLIFPLFFSVSHIWKVNLSKSWQKRMANLCSIIVWFVQIHGSISSWASKNDKSFP